MVKTRYVVIGIIIAIVLIGIGAFIMQSKIIDLPSKFLERIGIKMYEFGINDCTTLSTAGATYTLIADIINDTLVAACIAIVAQNITLDCNGFYIKSEDNQSENFTPSSNESLSNETKPSDEVPVNKTQVPNPTLENKTITNQTEFNVTAVIIANETIENETTVNETLKNNIITRHYKAIIGKPVKWLKTVNITENLTVELPKDAENISIMTGGEVQEAIDNMQEYDETIEQADRRDVSNNVITGAVVGTSSNILAQIFGWFKGFFITGKVISEGDIEDGIIKTENSTIVELDKIITPPEEVAIEYYTEAPTSSEKETATGKIIIISGPDDMHYEDVLAYTILSEEVSEGAIKFYHISDGAREEVQADKYDLNENGLVDYLEWNVPHLSEQEYELIIEISRAEHLNPDREFISNIYEQVRALDGIWSEEILDGEYVRVTFEKNLTKNNDITLYPRIISGNPAIQVYEKGGIDKIAEFVDLSSEGYNRVYLTNLQDSQDTFDLKMIGGNVEFDHIIDPVGLGTVYNSSIPVDLLSSSNWTITGIDVPSNATAAILLLLGGWMDGGTGDHLDLSNFDGSSGDYFTYINAGGDAYSGRQTAGLYVLKYGEGGFPARGATGLTFQGSFSNTWQYGGAAVLLFLSGTTIDGTFIIGNNATTINDDVTTWTSGSLGAVTADDLAFIAAAQYQAPVTVNSGGQTELISGTSTDAQWGIGYEYGDNILNFSIASSGYQAGIAFAVKAETGADATPPTISILYPSLNNTGTINTGLNINYTAADETALDSCWYSNDSYTLNVSLADCSTNITGVTWDEGIHNLRIYANDSSNNINSAQITFAIDLTPPDVNFTDPTPANETTAGGDSVYINVSTNDLNGHSVWVDWNRSLAGWWSMDSYNDSGIYDNSTWDRFGNLTEGLSIANLSLGKRGNAMEFNGIGGYIQIGTGTDFSTLCTNYSAADGIQGCSFGAWIKIARTSSTYLNVLERFDAISEDRFFTLTIDNGNHPYFDIFYNGTTTTCEAVSYDETLSLNAWHYLVGVYNLSDVILYSDGRLIDKTTCSFSSINSTAWQDIEETRIGGKSSRNPFNGSIDNVMLFSRALSSSEVIALYNATSSKGYYNNLTGLDNGNYTYKAWAIDSAGNINSTETKTVTIGTGVANPVSNCGILSTAGATYTLIADIINDTLVAACIAIVAQNITLDCNGFYIKSEDNQTGIYSNDFNSTIKNCNVSMGSGGNTNSIGIELQNLADNSTILNNILNNNYYGIYSGAEYCLIQNNTADVSGFGGSSKAIYFNVAQYNNLTNNIAKTSISSAFYLDSDSSYNILDRNIGISNSGSGFLLAASSNNNNLTNNLGISNTDTGIAISSSTNTFLMNNTATSNSSNALYVYNSINNVIIDQNATGYLSSSNAITLRNASYNNISNSTFSGITRDVYLYNNSANPSIGNILINCSYSSSKETVSSGNSLTRKWYYRAYVNDTAGTAINNANVTAFNSTGSYQFNLTTDGTGYTSITQIIDYNNLGGARDYYSNYTIYAANTTLEDAHPYNVSSNLNNLEDGFTIKSYSLQILSPTTSSPVSVSGGSNISLLFLFLADGANITSGVSTNSIYIGGTNSNIKTHLAVNGSGDVQLPTSCIDSAYISSIEIYSNWTIPGSGDINVTKFWWYQPDSTFAAGESLPIQLYYSNGTIMSGKNLTVHGTGAAGWVSTDFPTTFTLTEGGSYWIGMLLDGSFNIARDEGANCANYLPNQGSQYNSPGDGVFDSTVPASVSVNHYGIFGFEYETYGDMEEYGFVTGMGWQVNVTVPNGLTGLQDLFINATYNGLLESSTQTNAVDYGGGGDTCTCPSLNSNWNVNMGDNCTITQDCNLGTGRLNFTGAGNFSVKAVINTTGMGEPPSGSKIYMFSNGRINVH